MFTILDHSDSEGYQFYYLPSSISGTVYVRLVDSDRTSGNRELDSVHIDHMYIRTIVESGTPPAAPANLTATAVSDSQIDLTWSDNASDETGYRFERSTDGINFSENSTLNPDDSSFSDTGLAPSTTYFYRLYAYNLYGDSAYDEANATTDPGGFPDTVHIADLVSSSVWIRNKWNAVVTITVVDQDGNPVNGAVVYGLWSDGASGEGSCTSDPDGRCDITKSNNKSNLASITFSVVDITKPGYVYDPSDNQVSATIIVYRP